MRLILSSNGTAGPAIRIILHKLVEDFGESGVTWNKLGGGTYGKGLSGVTFPFAAAGPVQFDSTLNFKQAVKGALSRDGFLRLIAHTAEGVTTTASFASDEQPQL